MSSLLVYRYAEVNVWILAAESMDLSDILYYNIEMYIYYGYSTYFQH